MKRKQKKANLKIGLNSKRGFIEEEIKVSWQQKDQPKDSAEPNHVPKVGNKDNALQDHNSLIGVDGSPGKSLKRGFIHMNKNHKGQ